MFKLKHSALQLCSSHWPKKLNRGIARFSVYKFTHGIGLILSSIKMVYQKSGEGVHVRVAHLNVMLKRHK